jgi:hypothetical protein
MFQIVTKDDQDVLRVVGQFSTEERAKTWWNEHDGANSPWTLVGFAHHVSGRDADAEWYKTWRGVL